MEQLLQITTIPLAFELKIKNAHLEYPTTDAEVEITRNDAGNYKIKGRPVKINMDTFQLAGMGTQAGASESAPILPNSSTYNATGQSVDEGKFLINAVLASGVSNAAQAPVVSQTQQAAASAVMDTSEFTMRYEMDKLNFDLRSSHGNVEFIPGDIELVVTQHPEIKIEYVGKPLYVPPSVAEHFEVRA